MWFTIELSLVLKYWWADLSLLLIGGGFAYLIVPWSNRWVRVDRFGVWIDGELAIPAGEVRAVVAAPDTGGFHAHPIDEHGRWSRHRVPMFPARAWKQASWSRVEDVPGIGSVVVPRAKDCGRATWLSGALVVTGDKFDRMRVAWFLVSYRSRALQVALVEMAPHVDELLRLEEPDDADGPAWPTGNPTSEDR